MPVLPSRQFLQRPHAILNGAEKVTHLQELHVPAFLDDLAGDLVPEDHTGWGRSPPAYHVLVAAADVGAYQFEDHAMLAFARP